LKIKPLRRPFARRYPEEKLDVLLLLLLNRGCYR
jgi:hypothetical protein